MHVPEESVVGTVVVAVWTAVGDEAEVLFLVEVRVVDVVVVKVTHCCSKLKLLSCYR